MFCNNTDIQKQTLLVGEGDLLYLSPTSVTPRIVTGGEFICTDFNEDQDWTTGELANVAYNASDVIFLLG